MDLDMVLAQGKTKLNTSSRRFVVVLHEVYQIFMLRHVISHQHQLFGVRVLAVYYKAQAVSGHLANGHLALICMWDI